MAGITKRSHSIGRLLLIAVLSVVASGHQARAQTFLADNTWAVVSVECFAYAGTTLQNSYGLWFMQQDALSSIVFNIFDDATTTMYCHFSSLANGVHQWFPVYETTGLATCGTDCNWTIEDTGFFLLDPVTNNNVQVYPWLAPPDPWTEPV